MFTWTKMVNMLSQTDKLKKASLMVLIFTTTTCSTVGVVSLRRCNSHPFPLLHGYEYLRELQTNNHMRKRWGDEFTVWDNGRRIQDGKGWEIKKWGRHGLYSHLSGGQQQTDETWSQNKQLPVVMRYCKNTELSFSMIFSSSHYSWKSNKVKTREYQWRAKLVLIITTKLYYWKLNQAFKLCFVLQ